MKNITLRRTGQWLLVFVLSYFWIKVIFFNDRIFDFEACCPFGGLQSIATFFINGALACNMEALQVVMGGLLALSIIFVSKLFCGHVCPVGTVSEGLGRLAKKLRLPKYEFGNIGDMIFRSLKYILLFITFYFTLGDNELFCRKFDPFYGAVTLYGEDVSTWMATVSISVLLGGSLFIRQFWCRYLCPLGALSSAFKYVYVFVAFAAILFILNQAGIQMDLVIGLAVLATLAYSLEIIGLKKRAGLQLLKVTRNEELCIDCGKCDKSCPQGIKVSQMKQVNHPDCNLCMECMGQCPHDESIGLNGSTKFRWLPTLITVVLIMAGFIFGTNMKIPTVDMKWGSEEEMQKSAVFEMAGLKNVKCYGSSMTFVDQMKRVPGVTGAATYVRDHSVMISYDSTRLSAEQVRRSLFTPKFIDLGSPENEAEVHVVDLFIENFFDELDVVFLANLADETEGIYSFETYYGKPVKVRFYTNGEVSPEILKKRIEGSDLVYATAEESFSSKGLYTVNNIMESDTILNGLYLKRLSFPSFSRAFNNRSKYSNEELEKLIIPIKSYPKNQQFMPFVINHLGKADEYIVGMVSQYSKNGPVAVVFYVKDKTDPQKIFDLITQPELTVTYDNGMVEQVFNPYTYKIPEELKEELEIKAENN